jgi:hypothetical protein
MRRSLRASGCIDAVQTWTFRRLSTHSLKYFMPSAKVFTAFDATIFELNLQRLRAMKKRDVLVRMALLGGLTAWVHRPALALYDPKPSGLLTDAIGKWKGSLVYADYQNAAKRVTLPCTMTATLLAPDELALFYVFDDGPGKIVYSYERMAFDWAKKELTWTSSTVKNSVSQYALTTVAADANPPKIQFERAVSGGTDAFSLEIGQGRWLLTKRELRTGKPDLERSRYAFAEEAG